MWDRKMKLKLRKYIRVMLYTTCFYSGIFYLIRFIANKRGSRVTILTFHRVGENKNGEINQSLPTSFVSKGNFEKIIRFLSKHYKIISLSDYMNICNGKNEIIKNSVIITFDDGYKDIYENGHPILNKYKVPATVFLTSSFINSNKVFWWDHLYAICKNCTGNSSLNNLSNEIYTKNLQKKLSTIFAVDKGDRNLLIWSLITDLQDYDPSKLQLLVTDLASRFNYDLEALKEDNEMLSWENIKKLKTTGITFGSHTKSHLFFNGSLSKDIVYDEVRGSKLDIEDNLKSDVFAFAYPGGKITQRLKETVKNTGYKVACTQRPGINSKEEDFYALKRINIWDGTVAGFKGRFSKSLFAITLIKNSLSVRRIL
jgi:peptidoglycan/xylan/chitin deacetylase (PgdA/CDA1 family)